MSYGRQDSQAAGTASGKDSACEARDGKTERADESADQKLTDWSEEDDMNELRPAHVAGAAT